MRVHYGPNRNGFSLIELMVALAVAGILAAIAYPAYTSHMQRARRSDAIAALTAVMQAQERYRSNRSSYAQTTTDLQLDSDLAKIAPYYDITLAGVGTATVPVGFQIGYSATATPKAGQKQANDTTCKAMIVTLRGATPTYSSTGDPGNADTTSKCWPK